MNAKRFYKNGCFPNCYFNLYAYWNNFMYKLYKNRNNDIAPFVVCFLASVLLMYFVILK